MIKLGSEVIDAATGLTGTLTHLQIEMNGNRWYHFQPRGLNPENGQPVTGQWIVPNRINRPGPEKAEDSVDLPLAVLGTHVEDAASGFNGMAVALTLHINGCVHFDVQPKGVQEKSGAVIKPCNFDLRRLRGAAIRVLGDFELEASRRQTPSPEDVDSPRPVTAA